MKKYKVFVDSREQKPWIFEASSNCEGSTVVGLKTGDYSIEGYENKLVIERKGTLGEFAGNILQKRFVAELVRLEAYEFPFIILEFDMADIFNFPEGSGIPKYLWPKLRISPWYILKCLVEYQLKYKTKIILAGKYGKETAASIFKRVIELDERET